MFNGADFSAWNVWHYPENIYVTNAQGLPELHYASGMPVHNTDCGAMQMAERVKFMEESFDWNLMVYQLMPYFWGVPTRWKKLCQLNDNDPLFLNFLQAGMAKVIVPVKRGFENGVMHLISQGIFTPGMNDLPAIPADIYKNVMKEMHEADEMEEKLSTQKIYYADQPTVEKTWLLRVPTTLTVVQENSGPLAYNGLLCDCGTEADRDCKSNEGLMQGLSTPMPPAKNDNGNEGDTNNPDNPN